MKKIRLSLLASSLGALFLSTTAYPAAFQFYELGTPIIGTAGVGQAVVARDASIAYFNPAGMGQVATTQFMVGSQMMLPYNNFSIGSQNTIFGNNGGNAGTLVPGMGLYYIYAPSSRFRLGISMTSPYGGMLNYNDGWVGRYVVQGMQFYTINLNPAISYNFNEWFALGAGFSVEYANLQQTVALPITPSVDGQATIKANNTAPGFNIGLMLTPAQQTKIGLAYRSRIIHNLHGNTTFFRISPEPSTSTSMTMPQNLILSLQQGISNNFNLLAELGWANWASMRRSIVNIGGYTAVTNLNWSNTYRAGLAGEYQMTPAWMLHAGLSYDSSPTNSSHRTPELPVDRQVRAGLGLIYSVGHVANIGLSYEYIGLGNAPISNTSSNGVLAGNYNRNYANVVQASINVLC